LTRDIGYIYINKLVILQADIFQTAEYAENVAAFIDEETDRKYFWTFPSRSDRTLFYRAYLRFLQCCDKKGIA
jgi:hypothetical protein